MHRNLFKYLLYTSYTMGRRKGGARAGTRRMFRKSARTRGKISFTKFFAKYEVGDNVVLNAEPALQKNLYHGRFHGRSCIVTGKRGDCYELKLQDGGKAKMIIVHPVHLKRGS